MGDITTIGFDLAKNVFQVHAVDTRGGKRWCCVSGCDAAKYLRSLPGFRRAASAWKPVRRRIIRAFELIAVY